MYLVVQDHRKGAYIPETDIDRTSLVRVSKDLLDRQYSQVLAVIEINPVEHIARDVTHEFKDLIDPEDLG